MDLQEARHRRAHRRAVPGPVAQQAQEILEHAVLREDEIGGVPAAGAGGSMSVTVRVWHNGEGAQGKRGTYPSTAPAATKVVKLVGRTPVVQRRRLRETGSSGPRQREMSSVASRPKKFMKCAPAAVRMRLACACCRSPRACTAMTSRPCRRAAS